MRYILLLSCLTAILLLSSANVYSEGTSKSDTIRSTSGSLDSKEFQLLSQRIDSELRSANIRYQALSDSIDRMLYGLSGLTTILLIWSFFRDYKVRKDYQEDRELQRKDYLEERNFYQKRVLDAAIYQEKQHKEYIDERKFYEKSVLNSERRQAAFQKQQQAEIKTERDFFFQRIMEREKIVMQAAEREAIIGAQQVKLGEDLLGRSDKMLESQIGNMTKLGEVIQLVKNTFTLHLTKEEEEAKLFEKLRDTTAILDEYNKFFNQKYDDVQNLMKDFANISAMGWASLAQEQSIASRSAIQIFNTVPTFIVDKKDEMEVARLLQLLGTSAFSTNDIVHATKFLEESHKMFRKLSSGTENISQAYCSYFLALVEKSWINLGEPPIVNLRNAERHLNVAMQFFRQSERVFLMMVTLAEIKSYIEEERDEAKTLLIDLLGRIKQKKILGANQKTILRRAILLKGNLEFLDENYAEALEEYNEGKEKFTEYPFFSLSLGLVYEQLNKVSEAIEEYQLGIDLLKRSNSLNKMEISVRMIGIVWAIIATNYLKKNADQSQHICNELSYYTSIFNNLVDDVQPIAGREILFFEPRSKMLQTKSDIRRIVKEMNKQIN